VPEVPRTESGLAIGPVEGIEQDNLITDSGLDQMAGAYDMFFHHYTVTSGAVRAYLAVGTGSSTPAFSDTALANEVQRSNLFGSFAPSSEQYEFDMPAEVARATNKVTRIVTMTADRVLTEFGFSPEASTATALSVRELLRDSGGNPVSVSLLEDKALRVDHTVVQEIALPAAGNAVQLEIREYDAGNNLVNTILKDCVYGGTEGTTNQVLRRKGFLGMANPTLKNGGFAGLFYGTRLTSAISYSRTVNPPAGGTVRSSVNEPYVAGTRELIKYVTMLTADENAPWYGFTCRTSSGSTEYFFLVFDSPYTKQNTDTLRIGIKATWDRA